VMNHDDFADYLLDDKIPEHKSVLDIPNSARAWIGSYMDKNPASMPLFIKQNKAWFESQSAIAQGKQLKLNFIGSYQGKYVNISREKAIENLKAINESSDHEESYSFLKDGSVYWKRSNKDDMIITFTTEEVKMLKNGDLIHNHPGQGMYELSAQDLFFLLKNELRSITSISSKDAYIAVLKEKPSKELLDNIKKVYTESEIYIENKLSTADSRTVDEIRLNMQHYINIEFCKRVGIQYLKSELNK